MHVLFYLWNQIKSIYRRKLDLPLIRVISGEKPYLKFFVLIARKKQPSKMSRFFTESRGFLMIFAKISRFITLKDWQVCFRSDQNSCKINNRNTFSFDSFLIKHFHVFIFSTENICDNEILFPPFQVRRSNSVTEWSLPPNFGAWKIK